MNIALKSRNSKLIFSLAVALLVTAKTFAQFGIGLAGMRDLAASQQFNPANIGAMEFGKIRISVDASGWINNAHLPLSGILGDSAAYIDSASKEKIIGHLKSGEVAMGGYRLGLLNVNARIQGISWQFGLNDRLMAGAGFNNPNTAGLILKGNKHYLNQTITDEGVYAQFIRYRELTVGAAFGNEDFTVGVRGKLLQGKEALNLKYLDYSFTTDSIGSEILVQADYEASTAVKGGNGLFNFRGAGAGLDVGMNMRLNEKMSISAAVLDVGFVSFKSRQFNNSIDLDWEGVEITTLFASDIPEQIEAEVDSLRDLLIPDSVIKNVMLLTPVRIQAGLSYELSQGSSLNVNVIYSPIASMRTKLPLVSVGYFRDLFTGFKMGATLSGLGTDLFGFGLAAFYRLKLPGYSFDFALTSDNVLGFIPNVGRGMSLLGTIGFNL